MGTVMQWAARHPAVIIVLKTAVAALLLTGLFRYVDVQALIESVRSARADFLAAGALLLIPNLWIQFLRWRSLLRTIRCGAENNAVFSSLAAGFTAGFFTPAQLGEIGGRLYGLDAGRRSAILTMAALDKVYVLGMTIVLGLGSALIYFPIYLPSMWGLAPGILCFVVAAGVGAALMFPSLAKIMLLKLPESVRAHRFYAPIRLFEADFSDQSAFMFTLQTAALFGVIILQYHCFVNAFAPASLQASVLCVPIVLFVKSVLLPISIADLGVRESASVFFYLRMGVPGAAALEASLCIFAVNLVLPSVLGIAVLMKSSQRK
jgi:hypothetical protein